MMNFAAHSDAHNQQRCLMLRVLGIDGLRLGVLRNLSLQSLWSMRRVCRDFLRWSLAECSKLTAMPFCNQSAYGGISMVEPGQLRVFKLEHVSATRQDSAIACGADGSIYRAGGFLREGMGTEADPAATNCVDVWRPNPARSGAGSWHTLPPLQTARTHARACTVRLADGVEALVVIGGRARRMSSEDIATVEIFRPRAGAGAGVWNTLSQLPTSRRGFAVAACGEGRIAVVGGEARTPAAVVGGVVV